MTSMIYQINSIKLITCGSKSIINFFIYNGTYSSLLDKYLMLLKNIIPFRIIKPF